VRAGRAATLALAAALAFVGCGGDDGGDDSSAASSGDPNADADRDFLPDGDESTYGTDPENPDTDGDRYLDGDEVLEETDPLDPESRIYQGGWPYQRDKDQIDDPGFDGTPEVGAVVPRLVSYDQFGDRVDLYDFALHDKKVVLDLSALWCGPCKDLASWLEGEPSTLDESPELSPIREMVNAGEILWITVLFEDGFGNPAGPEQAVAWAEAYDNPHVAVLNDDARAMYQWLYPGTMPSVQILGPDMTLQVYDRFEFRVALESLLE
jgi:thiol-disulfide isomerase/thioredoxin